MIKRIGAVEPSGTLAAERLIAADVCRSAVHLQRAASTNTVALEELASGQLTAADLPRLYLADKQEAGRGRHGRSWLSTTGTLTFSLLVEQNNAADSAHWISLACGVGIARAIEFCFAPIAARLKWPNDVYLQGGKVAGVLCEANQASRRHTVIGIGVNAAEVPAPLQLEHHAPVRSLADAAGRPVSRYECLEEIVQQVRTATEESSHDRNVLLTDYRARCLLTGHSVKCQIAGQSTTGTCLGISDDGALTLQTDQGIIHCRSGEAQLIRRVSH